MRNGEIHNIDYRIKQLEEGIEELKKLKEKDFSYFIPYPVFVNKPDELGLPLYTTTYMGAKLYSVLHTIHRSNWSKQRILLKLQMNAPIKIVKNPGCSALNIQEGRLVRFIASDGYYVFVKLDNAKNWIRLGEYINFSEVRGGVNGYVDSSWK